MAEARELSEHERDPEMQAYARQEFEKAEAERDRLEGDSSSRSPQGSNRRQDVIRIAMWVTGGLFAADLLR